ncbi:DUF3261 domain-containing protein [Marinomonas sp. RSW2]|uniref:DUF3261 domain-containing protein n=1 Tax=Marinomonas maritima TaxID=2940935 RepID=A0ABT5WA21_9GAMM|nr:DUF3261 domain-containing protein [Marinomonas maritima]MDE8601677.1 DUF3261 domain-containing protein [Marinomonas maritima]
MPSLIRTLLLLSVVVLAGCSVFRTVEKPIDGLMLLPPVKGTDTQVLKQKVTLKKYTQTKQFLAVTRFSAEETKLVALLPTGQIFLYLIHDKNGFEERNETGIALPSKDILAMIQFTFWPESAIKLGYPESQGWQMAITPKKRDLYYKKTLLLEVKIEGENVSITHHGDNYNVDIHTFDQEVLPL